jgi:hypothetical protein
MKTVRFSEVVNSSGKPETHLLLIAPAKDKTLQAAIKSHRVMTVYQGSGTTKTDYGTIGFEEGSSRQFLVFPKALNSFADKRVIGIKYDLLESMPVSKDEATSKTKSAKAPKPTRDQARPEVDHRPTIPKGDVSDKARSDVPVMVIRPAKSEAVVKPADATQSKKKPPARVHPSDEKPVPGAPPKKVLEFPKPQSNAQPIDRSDEIERLKRRVREAIDVLEQGNQVAAYNLLKGIVEE